LSHLAIRTLALLLIATSVACSSRAQRPPRGGFKYPEARTVDQVDTFHGVDVADPYRWMEEDSDELKAWIEAQNKITLGWLRDGSDRRRIRARLKELWNYEKFSVPKVEAGKYVFRRNSGLENQASLYIADTPDAEPRVLLDPNTLSADGTVALRDTYFSPDGTLMAYEVSSGGSDWKIVRVREVASGDDLPSDQLTGIKFSGVSWNAEGSGFYYTRMAQPEAGQELKAADAAPKVFYHSVGTTQADDVLVYERPDEPKWSLYPWATEDGQYLIVFVMRDGSVGNAIHIQDLKAGGKIEPLIEDFDARNWVLGNDGPMLYVHTDRAAPMGRVVGIDVRKPEPAEWKTIIPESRHSIERVSLVGDRFFVNRLRLARSQVAVHRLDGTREREIRLPTLGSVFGIDGRRKSTELFYGFSSFTYPTTIFRYDIASGESTVFRRPKIDFDPEQYYTRQVTYKVKGSERVTMFISHKRGIQLDGSNPTLLYGYGGFNSSMTPYFSVTNLVWMEMGGVYAVANVRGGGELGKAWHDAGRLKNKQNSFDDFVAAAESLIFNKYTSPKRLAIQGASNGGLLVGACLNQRPELFGAALPSVGVMDMLRYHRFTAGRYWVTEYGSPDDPEMFQVLAGYSPYHNIRKGVRYPATLIATADHDDRVVPLHSFKYAARLQAAQGGDAPILIRIDTRAGHGAGTPTSKRIELAADEWTFLARSLRMDVDFD